MKTRKKLLALFLTLAMALSCVVSAGATSPSRENGVGAVDPADEGEALPDQQTQTKYASGSAEGSSRSEGPLPVDPIRLELPTVNADVLNMILDPHGLINATNAARYAGENHTVTFAENTPLYFLKSVTTENDATTYAYDNSSQELTITNKSNLEVGVDVTLLVNKGESDFTFVADEADLEEATDAAMYLAIQSGESKYAVADFVMGEDDEYESPEYADPTIEVGEKTDSANQLADAIDATEPAAYVADQYPLVAFQWAKAESEDEDAETADVDNEAKEAFIGAFGDYSFTLAYATETETDNSDPDNPVTTTVGASIEFSAGDDVPAGYTVTAEPATIKDTTRDVNVTVTFATSGDDGVDIAYAYFVVKAGTIITEDAVYADGNDVAFTFAMPEKNVKEADARAHFVTSLDLTEGAYVKGWDEDGGYFWAFVEDYEGEDDLTLWGHEGITAPADDDYNKVTFNLYGSINTPAEGAKTSAWDELGSDITLDLIWDVFEVKGEVGDGNVPLSGDAPTIRVSTKTTSSNKKLVLTWTQGTEDYAAYTPSTTLTLDDGATLTMTAATTATGGTLTNSNNSTLYSTLGSSSTVGTIVFTASGKPNLPLTVTAMR